MVKRIVSCNDLVYEELKEAYDVVKDYLCEALGRYDVESFAMFGTFYFIDDSTVLTTQSQQNLFSVSNIGNLCYLTVKDNRAKRDKTIYEYVEDRPSYTFDYDYLHFIGYPSQEELKFINYPNTEFRNEYQEFVKQRANNLRNQFFAFVTEIY